MKSVARSSVAIVGCGAVGGHLAAKLAAAGVPKIALVDNDAFSVDNLRRHLLDLSHVGRRKVDAMKEVLLRRSPDMNVEALHGSAEAIVNSSMVRGYDVLVMATGDPNLERMLNDRVHDEIDRVHVWLEPLGIGGHVLVVRGGHSGCFRCLFDSSGPINNRLSFVHPGKDFTKTIAGCGGEFVPFADLDANRAAIEGARAVLDLLEGKHDVSTAISWREDDEQLRSAGYALSPLGESMTEGTRRSFVLMEACPRCR
jgi:molybdopterin/thiamine biosynthesis adenylyltransferase